MSDDLAARLSQLESKVQELDILVNMALRLLAVDRPITALLESYGATEKETRAVHALLDDVAARAEHGGDDTPSLGGFEYQLFERFPRVRGNRDFVAQLIDTLKLDRPAYQKLYGYAAAQWTGRAE